MPRGDRLADVALETRLLRGPVHTIEAFREDPSNRRFPDSARPAKQVSLGDPVESDGVAEDLNDVVLTDQAMPGLNGGELAALIKERAPSLPVILVTGFGDILEATDGQPAAVDLVLTKPISMAVLRDTLAELRA